MFECSVGDIISGTSAMDRSKTFQGLVLEINEIEGTAVVYVLKNDFFHEKEGQKREWWLSGSDWKILIKGDFQGE